MKTFTVKLTRGATRTTAVICYRDASWPASITWSGDRNMFRLSNGGPIELQCTMDRIHETVAHQAKYNEATFEITEDGGDAPLRTDEVKG